MIQDLFEKFDYVRGEISTRNTTNEIVDNHVGGHVRFQF